MNSLDSAERKYAVGSVVSLGSITLHLRIQSHIAVHEGHRSQIFTAFVETSDSTSDMPQYSTLPPPNSRVCVKIFDYDLVEVDDEDWIGSRAEFCSQFFCTEATIYERLTALGGAEVPCIYYVSTVYVSIAGPYHAIIFEYIDQPSLSGYNVQSEGEMKLLEAASRSAIEKLHANGVYHGDIRGSNILWSLSTRRLVLLDFEMSLVFDGKKDHVIKVWKELDRGDLDYVLGKCRGRLPSLYP